MADGITLEEDAEGAIAAAVRAGLVAHRRASLPPRADGGGRLPLTLAWRDAGGELRAGLVGEVSLDWLFVDKFWVDASLRGQGLGARLLATAEAWAKGQGAVGAHLYTSSFQAPGFYEKQGYREIGRLPGRPEGFDRIWYAKNFFF
nr:GNAT family N-acetyltransferase [Roseomonas sp. GC11]